MISENKIVISAPFGYVQVTLIGDSVSCIEPLVDHHSISDNKLSSELALEVVEQFQSYFATKSPFTFPIIINGTDFQKKVWCFLQSIPEGETRTYGDIAQALHTSARAVGGACRRNPLAILIPCHRVISASGQGGYCGETTGPKMQIKNWLLSYESH